MTSGLALLERFGINRTDSLPFMDDLTGLPNRRFLRRALESLIAAGKHFSLLFMDLDDFKKVNDGGGHEEGDQLLRKLALLLEGSLRSGDFVARYGGDEFVIIACGGTEAGGVSVAKKILSEISRVLTPEWGVSASIGIALFPEHASVASDLVTLADNAMYAAKSSGKSCWKVSLRDGSTLFWHDDAFMARSKELDRILSAMSSDHGNSLIIVLGEPGSGKTSLLAVLAERQGGRALMRLQCRPELSDIPWAALVQAVRVFAKDHEPPHMPPLWKNLLGRLMPEIFGESDLTSTRMDKLALLDAFSTLLRGWTPLAVFLDDAQWLDAETSGLLVYALQTGVEVGLSACAAIALEGRAETRPVSLLADLPMAVTVFLEMLTPFQTAELIRGRLGVIRGVDDLARTVYGFSGGNPLFACEYLRSMLNTGMLHLEDGILKLLPDTGTMPDRIRNIVGRKLGLLDLDSRRLLQQGSVIRSGAFDTTVLIELSDRTEGEVLNILDLGLKHGILRTGKSDPMAFHFTNDAYRNEVYRSAGVLLLKQSHAIMAARRFAEGEYLASGYHSEHSGEPLRALEVYRQGARAGLRAGLPETAVSCLEHADRLGAELTVDQLPLEQLRMLKAELFEAYRLAGDWSRTREIALQHAELSQEMGEIDEAGQRSRMLAADCLRMSGDYEQAMDELEAMEVAFSGTLLIDCMMRCADSLSRLGRTGDARSRLDSAEELVDACRYPSCPSLRTELIHQRLILEMSTEDITSSLDLAEQLLSIIGTVSFYPWWYLYDMAEAMLQTGRPMRAVELFRKGVEKAMAEAALYGRLVIQAELLDALFNSLDLPGTGSLLGEVEDLAGRFSEQSVLDDCQLVRIQLAMESGRIDLAGNIMESQLGRRPENPAVAWVNSLLLERRNDPRGSLAEVQRAMRILDGVSMTSLIDLSVVVTFEEMRLQEGWVSYLIRGDREWIRATMDALPSMGPRAAFTAHGKIALALHRTGRTREAELLLSVALKNPDWAEMRLFRYRNLLIRSQWHPPSAEEARLLLK
jgi:diguanylate cyclase (GGDEF)-like protein